MANVLLVYPEHPVSFWSFDEALRFLDKASAFPPLGLLTIAGMLPDSYNVRLVDMNVEPLEPHDLEWADVAITSSMIVQWPSLESVIAQCNAHNLPILCGGPLPTQYHDDIEGDAVFYLGEAENGFLDVVEQLLEDPEAARQRWSVDRRGQFLSLDATPVPRWELIDFDNYITMVVQITRGCPEKCTFCNIPALYGKQTRLKNGVRLVAELNALYDAGWRGPVMAVDDNFAGNQETITELLEEEIIPWQQERGYPFQFNTQASIRVSDNSALLDAMHRAGFDKIFVGIESPWQESLKFMGAQKNLQGDTALLDKVKVLQGRGFEVQAGFILGLDTDPDDIAERMIGFIQEAGIPVAMVGLLGVLRDTPDYLRFKRAGRLVESVRYVGDSGILSRELSFVPVIDPDELLARHRAIVETINSPEHYFERCTRFFRNRGPLTRANNVPVRARELKGLWRSLWHQGITGSYRKIYWGFLGNTLIHHARSLPLAVSLAVQGHHLLLTTQRALQVDEMKTFLSEALSCLERFCEGKHGSFRRGAERYASRLMQAIQDRFRQFQDDEHTLRHNAAVLLHAAQEYYEGVREECKLQLREPLRQFQLDVERMIGSFAANVAG